MHNLALSLALVWLTIFFLSVTDDILAITLRLRTLRYSIDPLWKSPIRVCQARSSDLHYGTSSSVKTHVYLRLCLLFGKVLMPLVWIVLRYPELCQINTPLRVLAAVIFVLGIYALHMTGIWLLVIGSCDAWRVCLCSPLFMQLFTILIHRAWGERTHEALRTVGLALPCAINTGVDLGMLWHQRVGGSPCGWEEKRIAPC